MTTDSYMIKFKKDSSGLIEYSSQIPYIDTDATSKHYFRLFDIPDRLYLGKNVIRIAGNSEYLVNGSQIFIDILDSNNNLLYYEILDTIDNDNTRSIIIYVYPDTPTGIATIYIGSRIHHMYGSTLSIPWSEDPTDSNYKHTPNILWKGVFNVVPTKQNNTEIIFTTEPVIEYSEKIVKYDNAATSSRITSYLATSTDSIHLKGRIIPYQYSETSKFVDDTVISPNMVGSMPSITGNVGTSSPQISLPEFTELTKIYSDNAIFSGSMIGGNLYVRNINLARFIPKDAVDSAVFNTIPDYSASIVNVLNAHTIEVNRAFNYKVKYSTTAGVNREITFDSFTAQNNFTASYYTDRTSITTGSAYESFISVELSGVEPSVGNVNNIKVGYKPVGSFGEYVDVGTYEVVPQNLLTDPNVYVHSGDGMIEKPYGYVKVTSDINTYWTASISGTGITDYTTTYRNTKILDAVFINPTGSYTQDNYLIYKPRTTYVVGVKSGTEYDLKFNTNVEKYSGDWTQPILDVYISGSNVTTDVSRINSQISPIKKYNLGTYIGSINYADGLIKKNSLSFISNDSADILPIFVVRSGKWDIGQVALFPRCDNGYTPNQIKLNIPIAQFKRKSELLLKFQYYNSDGVKSNIDSKLYGVIFSGSSQISFNELNDIPVGLVSGSVSIPAGTVSSSQQVKDYLPSGVISGSGQLPSGTVSGSSQITYSGISGIPSGIISGSSQLPSNLVSSSAQITYSGISSIPSGIVSSSNQISYTGITNVPANIVSSSQQVKLLLPTDTVSGSGQIVGGPYKSIQYNYSGSLTGSAAFFYDPNIKTFGIGSDATSFTEMSYPSNVVIQQTDNTGKAFISFQGFGATPASTPRFIIIPDTGSGVSSKIGMGVPIPKTNIDILLSPQHFDSNRLSVGNSTTGSGITLTRTSSISDASVYNKYYKVFSSTTENTGSGNKIVILGSTDSVGRSFLHIGLENGASTGLSVADTTWVTIGSGSISSRTFSGSGYDIYDVDYNKLLNKPPGVITGSGQVNYDELINKPTVANIGAGRFIYNNNHLSQSIASDNITYTTMSAALQPINPSVFNLKNGTRLVHFMTSSVAGATHHAQSREYIFEGTGSIIEGTPATINTYMELTSYEGTAYTGSTHNAGVSYTIETTLFATSGSGGSADTYVWTGTTFGRATVSTKNGGAPIFYTPQMISGGMSGFGSYGNSRSSGSNYDSLHRMTFASTRNKCTVAHIFVLTGTGGRWDTHYTTKIKQNIYEIDVS